MQELQCLAQARQFQVALHFGRQQVGQFAVRERAERLRGQIPEAPLLNTLGCRVDRCQRIHHRLLVGRIGEPVFRVHDLESHRSTSHLPKAAQACATHKLLLLCAGEIEKPQRQESGAVGQPHEQRAASAEHHLGQLDLALDRDTCLRPQ